ncbi:hypothetical protein FAM8374_01294 [Lacticaseibacillus paracasei]|nr:hypothetical protein FAM8374_01294 [Lacticaseibacillus paracasei]
MLKLFYASGTSAMAPHILLTDAGLNFEFSPIVKSSATLHYQSLLVV